MWQKFLFLGLAGAIGTLTRYWLSGAIQRLSITNFPLGTVAINIIGCLLFGVLWAFLEDKLSISGQTRAVIFLGFFGAFTTFSSFAFETCQLIDESQWLWASSNILLQNVVGITGVLIGLAAGKLL
ncbi:MAG: fluoride efflux transporter CrcB [Sedimentisphaerales bacterium]|nr:fluoride efflux transporter CrcB [Sedimentisphaerales bacterium]